MTKLYEKKIEEEKVCFGSEFQRSFSPSLQKAGVNWK